MKKTSSTGRNTRIIHYCCVVHTWQPSLMNWFPVPTLNSAVGEWAHYCRAWDLGSDLCGTFICLPLSPLCTCTYWYAYSIITGNLDAAFHTSSYDRPWPFLGTATRLTGQSRFRLYPSGKLGLGKCGKWQCLDVKGTFIGRYFIGGS